MFDLKRPCESCPFRVGYGERFRFRPDRLREIRRATAFQCHKTVDYDDDSDGKPGDRPQQCAGLMAVLHREHSENTIMQIGERRGHLDPSGLDPKREAYENWAAVLKAHGAKA